MQYLATNRREDLQQILNLQQVNLPVNLSAKDQQTQGFVTVEHTLAQLQAMAAVCKHVIAKDNGVVVGYALSMTKEFATDIPILTPMFTALERLKVTANFIVMGQICIAKNYRGKGLFRNLYTTMQQVICKGNFELIITEIDVKNTKSLQAHKAIGFTEVADYNVQAKNWRIVALNV